MSTHHRILTCLFATLLLGCVADDALDDEVSSESEEVSDSEESEESSELAGSNPAPFDLHCLWAGEHYARRAPNQFAAQAIRNACNIQAALIPYRAPGMFPLQNRQPTRAEGIDCSGLTANVWYRATGTFVRLPHSAAQQESILRDVRGLANLKPGDLLFYRSSSAASGRHVKMYLGDLLTIEAAGSSTGVVVRPLRTDVTSIGRVVW